MRARKYNKKIDLYQTNVGGVNEFGTPTDDDVLITSSWCELVTLNTAYKRTEYGVTDTTDTIVVKLRKRNDITYNSVNQYFVYRGERYNMQTEPINVGFEDREIVITLKKEITNGATELQPIITGVFDASFDNTFN